MQPLCLACRAPALLPVLMALTARGCSTLANMIQLHRRSATADMCKHDVLVLCSTVVAAPQTACSSTGSSRGVCQWQLRRCHLLCQCSVYNSTCSNAACRQATWNLLPWPKARADRAVHSKLISHLNHT